MDGSVRDAGSDAIALNLHLIAPDLTLRDEFICNRDACGRNAAEMHTREHPHCTRHELFYADNCNMVYGDAQAVPVKMIEADRGFGSTAAASIGEKACKQKSLPATRT
jgi:hypothetical protein